MDYELAKKLKDAGFTISTGSRIETRIGSPRETSQEDFSTILHPTLTELIEACGDGFHALYKKQGGWLANSYHKIDEQTGVAFQEEWYGKTPEEAVSELWISLQVKLRK